MSTWLHVGRIIGLLLLAVGLAACSTLRLGYNNLSELAYWWLDGYVDFEDGQSQRVREDLARLHAWHRGTELPRAGELLARIEPLLAAEITPAQACALVPEFRARLQAVSEQAVPAIATLARELTPDQLQHLERKYARNNAEFRREWLRGTPGEQVDKRLKQWFDRAEMVYGRLNDAQRRAVREQFAASPFDAQRVLAERQRRQQDTLQTLRGVTQGACDAVVLVRGLLERNTQSPDPAYRRLQDALLDEGCRTVALLHNNATPDQRETALKRVRGWQRDLRELAAAQ